MKQIAIGLLFLLFISADSLIAQSGDWIWAGSTGGSNDDRAISKTSTDGSIYTAGMFSGTVDFDPGIGVFSLTSSNSLTDIFISKLDSNGNFIWAKKIGANGADMANSMAISTSRQEIIITGSFLSVVDFDPGSSSAFLASSGLADAFILKLDSAGNFIWAKNFGGVGFDQGFTIAIENDGFYNIYAGGTFSGTVDFDPGPSQSILTAIGTTDIFLSKTDSGGNFIWAKQFSGNGPNQELIQALILDESSGISILTTGNFSGTVDFDPSTAVTNLTANNQDIFISKLDSSGSFIWAKQIGDAGIDQGNALAVDTSGTFYVTGYFSGVTDFDPNAGIYNLTSSGGFDVFLAKLDNTGNLLQASAMGGSGSDFGSSLLLDANGSIYVSGGFQSTADFNGSAASYNLISAGGLDVFVVKTNNLLNFEWARRDGNVGSEYALSIAFDIGGSLQLTGVFTSATLSLGSSSLINQGVSNQDIFVGRMEQYISTGINSFTKKGNGLVIYPNPAVNQLTVAFDYATKMYEIGIYSILGELMYTATTLNEEQLEINTEFFPAGIYLLKVKSGTNSNQHKFCIVK